MGLSRIILKPSVLSSLLPKKEDKNTPYFIPRSFLNQNIFTLRPTVDKKEKPKRATPFTRETRKKNWILKSRKLRYFLKTNKEQFKKKKIYRKTYKEIKAGKVKGITKLKQYLDD